MLATAIKDLRKPVMFISEFVHLNRFSLSQRFVLSWEIVFRV